MPLFAPQGRATAHNPDSTSTHNRRVVPESSRGVAGAVASRAGVGKGTRRRVRACRGGSRHSQKTRCLLVKKNVVLETAAPFRPHFAPRFSELYSHVRQSGSASEPCAFEMWCGAGGCTDPDSVWYVCGPAHRQRIKTASRKPSTWRGSGACAGSPASRPGRRSQRTISRRSSATTARCVASD